MYPTRCIHMLRGLYAAANAMRYRANEVETVANNLANVTTDGFKRDRLATRSFGDMLLSRIEQSPEANLEMRSVPPGVGVLNLGGPVAETEFIDFSPGTPRTTGNALDLFIDGPGFFVVDSPNGERYTRAGSFSLDRSGTIVTQSGYTVQGANNQPLQLTDPSPFVINQDGEIIQNGLPVGKLKLVEFPDLRSIEKEGYTLYRLSDPASPQPYTARVSSLEQGTIESSNVDAIMSLVRLIAAQRAYEGAARAVDMFNQSLNRVSTELGRLPA